MSCCTGYSRTRLGYQDSPKSGIVVVVLTAFVCSAGALMKGKFENVEFQIGIDLFSVFDNFVEVRQRPHDPKPLRERTVRSYKQARDAFQIALRQSTDGLSLKRMVAHVIDEK